MARLIAYFRRVRNTGDDCVDESSDPTAALKAWARDKRHHIVAFFEDETDAPLEDRPGLTVAMVRLRDEGVDGLVVDRLASLDSDLVTQEQLLVEIRRLGARIYCVKEADVDALRAKPSDSSRFLVRQVVQTAAANESSMIALRSASRATNGGSPPFGYRMEDGRLVPDAAEQATLLRIAELRVSGATLRQIARTLNAEGHRAKRAEQWHPETLRRITSRTEP